jgi:hypothetical protein
MTIRSVRDWRGIKHHVSDYSTDDLLSLLSNAQHTSTEVTRFIAVVNAELAERKQMSRQGA